MWRKGGYVLLAILLLLGGGFFWYPWSLTNVLEGYPARTWPARGSFFQNGDINDQMSAAGEFADGFTPTKKFLEIFEDRRSKAIIVMKEGKVVYRHFAEGYDANTRFNTFSKVKSLVGVLVLKAVDEGKLSSLDATVGEVSPILAKSAIAPVTIKQLMDMKSGLSFEKPSKDVGKDQANLVPQVMKFSPFGNLSHLHVSGVLAIVDEIKLIEANRGKFSYQNLNTAILGQLLSEIYAMPLDKLLAEKIVNPAGAGGLYWRSYPDQKGVITPYCCLYATPDWWAKVDWFLMTNGGNQSGSQPFLSKDHFDYFIGTDLPDNQFSNSIYRSQIRYNVLDRSGEGISGKFSYFLGQRGQTSWLVPQENLIIVRFGEMHQLLHSTVYETFRSLKK